MYIEVHMFHPNNSNLAALCKHVSEPEFEKCSKSDAI